MQNIITFIGDVHGHFGDYLDLIQAKQFTVQLGDFGFYYTEVSHLDTSYHRFIPGNHENYPLLKRMIQDTGWDMATGTLAGDTDKYLSGFASLSFQGSTSDVYCIRGAGSLFCFRQTVGVNWFEEEEMRMDELTSFIQDFEIREPRVVASHECPSFVVEDFDDLRQGDLWKWGGGEYHASRTARAMTAAWEVSAVKPKLWVFGHHHVHMDRVVDGTRFVCVPELETFEIDLGSLL